MSEKQINYVDNMQNLEVFVKARWQKSQKSLIFVIYRWLFAAFFVWSIALYMLDFHSRGHLKHWILFETNWSLCISAAATLFAAFLATFHYFDVKSEARSFRILWFLYTTAVPISFQVSLTYWTSYILGYDRK
jgi:hypothetical protein